MSLKVLEICPYEPPASGWVSRVKLLRQVIEARGGRCQVLDIGPNRRWRRPGCIPVYGGRDYLVKVWRHARQGYTVHTHVNGEYFRGMLLALAAAAVFRLWRGRCVTTFHAGTDQPYFRGWRRPATAPVYRLLFALSQAVVCNSGAVKRRLRGLTGADKISAIAAFSRQYLHYRPTELDAAGEAFCAARRPLLSTYLCFRDGFFTATVLDALALVAAAQPQLGLVIVGTGPQRDDFVADLERRGLGEQVYLAGDLDHDRFMTLIARSALHLRTPVTDGVSSTVLEALHAGTPVVAADNGNRPPGVVLYRADDPQALAAAVKHTLAEREKILAALCPPPVADTAAEEVDLLAGRPKLLAGAEA